jgi:hypothetical protein
MFSTLILGFPCFKIWKYSQNAYFFHPNNLSALDIYFKIKLGHVVPYIFSYFNNLCKIHQLLALE